MLKLASIEDLEAMRERLSLDRKKINKTIIKDVIFLFMINTFPSNLKNPYK